MPVSVLIVEDEEAIRSNIARMLRLEGYGVAVAVDGRAGLEQLRAKLPDVLISDINMPHMNGFELLAALRADTQHPGLASLPVLMLTALDDRANMRRGMASGADDYLSKPFTRDELLAAVEALVQKNTRTEQRVELGVAHRISQALAQQEQQLRLVFDQALDEARTGNGLLRLGTPQPDGPALGAALGAEPDVETVVLFLGIRQFTALAEKLASDEVAELLAAYFLRCSQPLLACGGQQLRFVGDGLIALFSEDLAHPASAARRGVASALELGQVTHEFNHWLAQRFDQRNLPPLVAGVGLHCGLVQQAQAPGHDTAPIGETVNLTAQMQWATSDLGWAVVASLPVLAQAGQGVQCGSHAKLQLGSAEAACDACEIIGLEGGCSLPAPTPEASPKNDAQHNTALHSALLSNAQITARAVKAALQSRLSALKRHVFTPEAQPLTLRGYRILRKLGSGGITDIYLAVRDSDSLPVVLKVLDVQSAKGSVHLERFIREFSLLAKIDHPNVVKIYDQGFTDDHAYMAMEYFERGDLRANFDFLMDSHRAIGIIKQVAQALAVVHEHGIVHRDMKPDNIMLRQDDSVVLADFGIAKSLLADAQEWNQTRQDEVVGTPYYISPEQAEGNQLSPQSDLYSLGVMLFEMLAGHRPFHGDSLQGLLFNHMHEPTPKLPKAHAGLQTLVERLMAKELSARYPSAKVFLRDLKSLEQTAN
ncbi:MAG: protein kinase domain-containing protein [Burkholderiaceae bacterium]